MKCYVHQQLLWDSCEERARIGLAAYGAQSDGIEWVIISVYGVRFDRAGGTSVSGVE